ncbi:HNH endonuclease [Deinococcus humi]|uniref:Putative restriction endonuclease n=1 Tax=Deinococcus humi TaxID=662880 RepID=A0A7W8K0B3_9DEIO|nr:HNH endonuclease [Deinococcus humi]MBB5366486.1 putative restriction endonuclease [Deinococcus humi]
MTHPTRRPYGACPLVFVVPGSHVTMQATSTAAHVQPYASGGPHEVSNGLLRSDLHRLYDQVHITVEPDERRLLVSGRIREEFQNGRHYYALEGQRIGTFASVTHERLLYHTEHVYRA